MKIVSTKKNLINSILVFLIVSYSFYSLEPYFTWKTYRNGIFGYIFGIIPFKTLFGIMFIFVFLLKCTQKIKVERSNKYLALGTAICAVLLVGLSGGFGNTHIFSMAWISYIIVMCYLLLSSELKIKAYNIYFLIFAITLVLPIVYYLLLKTGIKIPYVVLEPQEQIKVLRGFYYKNYFGAVQRIHNYDLLSEFKLCGIYDESGKLGTLAALFLISERLKFKGNWKNILCLIVGVLSFSLAFYIIIVIYYCGMCIFNHKIKNIVVIIAVVIAYFFFMNINFEDDTFKNLQSRLLITDAGLVGDNRTNEQFDDLINEFNENSNIYTLIFGYGDGAIADVQNKKNIDGSSYKSFIYNYGYLGFVSIIIWLIIFGVLKTKNLESKEQKARIWSILLAYILNIYQRPTSFYLGYMLILIGAVEIIINEERVQQNAGITEYKIK